MGRDSDLINLNALTFVHRDTSNRTLHVDSFGPNDGVIRERARGGAVKATGLPCSCPIARASTRRQNVCSVCGGNADKRWHTPQDAHREQVAAEVKEFIERLKRGKARADAEAEKK